MAGESARALLQGFLPAHSGGRAFVWKYSPATGGKRPRHFHREPELNVVVQGSATFAFGQKRVELRRGELLGFPPGQDHELLAASHDLYLLAIGLEPSFSSDVLGRARPAAGVPLHGALSISELQALVQRADSVLERGGAEQGVAELWQQCNWLTERRPGGVAPPLHALTMRTLRALHDESDLGLRQLARLLGTHESEISRYFHRDMGTPFVRYRARRRLLEVVRSVDAGEKNLTRAAGNAGFGSYSQCHRVFAAELGCSPRQFFGSALREQMQCAYQP